MKKTDFFNSYIMTESPSQNVLTAQQYGCRTWTPEGRCRKPVISVTNAIVCEGCFQDLYQTKMKILDRHWCKNHGNGCLSEHDEYVPIPGIQSYTLPGCPGGAFKASGMFMLGLYCGACSLYNVAHSNEWAEQANAVPLYTESSKKRSRESRAEELISQLQHIPNKTNEQELLLHQATEVHLRQKLRGKKLKKEQVELEKALENLAGMFTPE